MARPRVVVRRLGGPGPDATAGGRSEVEVAGAGAGAGDEDDGPTELVLADAADIGTVVDAVLRGQDAVVWLTDDRMLRARAIDELGRIAEIVDEDADGPASGRDVDDGRSPSPVDDLDAEHRRLIALVADGSTITEAAREIGLSRRTAARRMATVRSVLGVATNAEAVVVWTSRPHDSDGL